MNRKALEWYHCVCKVDKILELLQKLGRGEVLGKESEMGHR